MSSLFDTFTRANGALGTTPDGLPWSVLSGSAAISSNKATASGNGTEAGRTIAIVGLSGDGAFTLVPSSQSGGESLYFRVSDAKNWWRLRFVSTTSYYSYVTNYSCSVTNNSPSWAPVAPSSYTSATNASGTSQSANPAAWDCTSTDYNEDGTIAGEEAFFIVQPTDPSGRLYYPDGHLQVVYSCTRDPALYTTYTTVCTPNYASGSYNTYAWYLDKCVNGNIVSTKMSSLSTVGSLGASCAESTITVTDGTHTQSVTDPFNQLATGVGFGTGPSSNYGTTDLFTSLAASYNPVQDSVGNMIFG